MKKLLLNFSKAKKLVLFFCLSVSISKAQYVTIPDAHFVNWLQLSFPTAMIGNQLDTTYSGLSSITNLIIGNTSDSIRNLDGIQYFSGLINLQCDGYINNLPALPRSIQRLGCSSNSLTSLPPLPNSLISLGCPYNHLLNLPALPNSLTYIDCSGNPMTSLPALPTSLIELHCVNNALITVPALPAGLKVLSCVQGSITHLPAFPNSITWLNLSYNQLTNLPALPNSLIELDCDGNALTSLPAFPNTLLRLSCTSNQLTALSILPYKLTSLSCAGNNITCYAPFSDSITSLNILNNSFNCLPNYTAAMDANTIAYPLCSSGNTNGCTIANSCAPMVIFNLNQDTLQPGLWYANPFYSSQVINAKWAWGDGTSTLGLYPSHTYTSIGAYNICVTAYASCGDSATYCQNDSIYRLTHNSVYNNMIQIDVMNGSPAAINQVTNKNNDVLVYPNPSNYNFTIETNSADKQLLNLFDVNGKLVLTQIINGTTIINVSTLAQGIYNVSITSNKSVTNKRLVIVH